jgi:membrane fusion protein, multidrug efflux system
MKLQRMILELVLLVLLGFCSCSHNAQAPEEEESSANATVEVKTATAQQGTMRQITPVSGRLNALPDRDVKVSALVPARINRVAVVEGDAVQKGQVVVTLDDSTLRDQLTQAKAALENARSNEERVNRLFERGIAAGKENEDAHKEFVTAQAAYDTARTQLERTRVLSPISGVIVQRFHGAGEQVDGTGSDPVVEVADFDPIELVASLPTSYLGAVQTGQPASVHTEAYPGKSFSGSVAAVLPSIDPATGTATVRIRIPNGEASLKGGMFAQAEIITDTHENALYVPAAALVVTNNEPKIFVVGADSKAHERSVQTGWREGDRIEILKGIQKGEVVVTTGSYGLADGMKVIPGKEHSTP